MLSPHQIKYQITTKFALLDINIEESKFKTEYRIKSPAS